MRIRNLSGLAILTATFFLLTSCGKEPTFKYRIPDDKSVTYSESHSVKSLVGGAADIVWVIDNSGSMGDEQQEVIQNAEIFMRKFQALAAGMNWRIGLLSTAVGEDPYIGFTNADRLDFSHADPVGAFRDAVANLGTGGDSQERSFDPIQRAFRRYPDFIRENAKLFLILVSDEEEQSSVSVNAFVNYLASLKKDLSNVVTFGILNEDNCGSSFAGTRYDEFLQATNGKLFSICSTNYGDLLGEIGSDIGRLLVTPKILLPKRPRLSSLKVIFRGLELPAGPAESGGIWIYDYNENSILFHNLQFAAGDNESVQVVFQFLP